MATTLSNYAAPTINGIAAARVLSETVLENIFQGMIERDGCGVTQRFTFDISGAEIRIVKVKPVKQFARRLGGAVNGGNFPISAYEGETDSFGIPVLDVLDTPIDIARVSKEMLPVDLTAEYIKSYTDQVNAYLNASTIAGKYYATFMKEAKGGEINKTVIDEEDLLYTVNTANGLLDEGVEEMDVAMFPQEGRCFVLQSKYRPILIKKGVLTIGGANAGYAIAENGTVSAGVAPRKVEDGFVGIIDGVECHLAAPLYFKLAAEYLGLSKKDLTQAVGYVSSSFANVRGVSATSEIKAIDHPLGQGTRLQPYTRWGFTVLPGYEKGNSFIVEKDFKNPYSALVEVFSDLDLKECSVLPVGSRLDLKSKTTIATLDTGSVQVSTIDGSKIAVVIDTNSSIDSVSGFAAAYAAEKTSKAILSNGIAKVISGLAGKKATLLVVGADGTCLLQHISC